ncbi:MAG: hypothetical protein HN396_17370 [Gemmatimonadales bacterium]|nr:hypothetical protein [Gemmatimonadales bacterium]MBT3500689.1 hypothetical protein [Gemmatimonadales bacterium]MBT3774641.1 hypothetical protein [Gemmatimonadales bacterium]MBT3957818.1 hypothetical protein [Gemmatimonadales bacterium]MBT4187147.1 hypothetical protein [Gemmatimonadales bacterium]
MSTTPDEERLSGSDDRRQSFVAAMSGQVRELSGTVRWVIRAAAQFRPQLARIVVLDLVSLFGWAAALGGFFQLLQALESGTPLALGRLEVSLAGGAVPIIGACAGLAVLGGFSAACDYVARTKSAGVAGALLRDLRGRLLDVVAGAKGDGWRAMVEGPSDKWIRRLVSKGAPMTALGLWSLLQTLLPFGIVLITGAFLVFVDPLLSALLLPLSVPYLLALSAAYGRVADSRRRYLEVNSEAVGDIVDAFGAVASSDAPTEGAIAYANRCLEADGHRDAVALFFELRLVMQRVKLINGVFGVVCIAAVLSFFVPLIAVTDRSWADPIGYVIGLRIMLLAAQRVSGGLAMVSRRIPEIASLSQFLDRCEGLTPSPSSTAPIRLDSTA